ncbi:MAG: undecaprenyldiphospho-muramoylpentapeptide beta-N-acetylglucosaminyltransferase [Oscillospiraceae bacterium]|nr:undecaprenyldiphospho-muramoylpentapeptide beta-N-acetylglucosaminyltransferase [Oscillospiraceae bacterium]
MKVIIAAGGTAGHINPGLAIAGKIKAEHPDADIMFVGRKQGMEYGLVTKAGYKFSHMEVTGFQRSFSPENIKRNLITVKNLLTANAAADKILNSFKPDLVMGTGGYVSGPIVQRAAKKGIKTALHEQNAFAGVTNKLLSKSVDKVFVATEKASKYMAHPEKCIPCGNPVRQEIIEADTLKAKEELGVQGKLVVLSFGGSLGAAMVNKAMQHLVAHNKNREDIVHFHVVGRYDEGKFERYLKDNNLNDENKIKVYEYLYDIAKYMAAADVIICRCGALTIAELSCMGKASILIPSPNVAENHQYHNGKVLEDLGAAILIEEKNLNEKTITDSFEKLYQNPQLVKEMGGKARLAHNPDCVDIIYNNLMDML